MSVPHLKKGLIYEFAVEKAAFEGKGLARWNDMAVFIPNTIPGDLVRARVIKNKKSFAEAQLIEVLEPSSLRITPKCSHATLCGGCTWQHADYPFQLAMKRDHVRDHLHRIGGLKTLEPHPTLGSERAFHYRNKMEYTFGDRRWLSQEEIESGDAIPDKDFAAGMHIPGRFDRILNLNECYLQDAISFDIMQFVKNYCISHQILPYNAYKHEGFMRNVMVRNSAYTSDLMVNLVTNGEEPELMNPLKTALLEAFPAITTVVQNVNDTRSPTSVGRMEHVLYGPGYIVDHIGRYSFEIHANAFFQTNTKQAEVLYTTAATYAEIKPTDRVYDLYCGVGTLTLFVSDGASQVIGIELNEVALQNARKNALTNKVTNVVFELGDMKDTFSEALIAKHGKPDVIITDPPRAGMHEDVVRQLLQLETPRIVYVSCNSATLSRDLALLNAKYDINQVQPVDMFPQTYHIESVAQLTLRKR